MQHEDCWLPTFDFNRLPSWAFCAVLVGSRGSGKTVAAQDFLSKTNGRFTHLYLCSGSEAVQSTKTYFPAIKQRYTDQQIDEVINTLIEIQREDLEKNDRDLKRIARPLVIIDDALGNDKSTWSSKILLKMATQGRHYNISLLYLTQGVTASLSKTVRENIDCWFVFRSGNQRLAAFLVETFLFFGHHRKATAYEYLKCAWSKEPYTMLCVMSHLIGSANVIQDFVFTYKASLK